MKKILCCVLCLCLLGTIGITALAQENEFPVLRQVYEPETKMILPPTVIEKLQTKQQLAALQTNETPPQALLITLDAQNQALVEGSRVALDDVLSACRGKVIPMLELVGGNASDLVAVLQERNETDLFVVSQDITTLSSVMSCGLPYVYGVYRANVVDDMAAVAGKAHQAGANTVLFRSFNQVTAAQVRYLQARFLTVFLDGSLISDAYSVRQAVDVGADGTVVAKATVAYNLYLDVDKVAYTRRPLIVGHRGFPTTAPENTVEGMKEAFKAGADAVECDVYLTADGHVVINHNGNLEGYTTDITATQSVSELTREQLKSYTLKPVKDYTDCKIAFLDELFDVLKGYPDRVLVIEIKTGDAAIIEKIHTMAKEYGVANQIVVISFIEKQMQRCREIMPEIGASYLFSPSGENWEAATTMLGYASSLRSMISPSGGSTTAPVRTILYLRGVACNVWTINGTMALKNQVRYGAMHLTTNDVGLAVAVREDLTLSTARDLWGGLSVTLPKFGDVDGDQNVTATDALEVLKSVVGKVTLTDEQLVKADTDGNGKIEATDALNILKKVVGKIDKFPVEQ